MGSGDLSGWQKLKYKAGQVASSVGSKVKSAANSASEYNKSENVAKRNMNELNRLKSERKRLNEQRQIQRLKSSISKERESSRPPSMFSGGSGGSGFGMQMFPNEKKGYSSSPQSFGMSMFPSSNITPKKRVQHRKKSRSKTNRKKIVVYV